MDARKNDLELSLSVCGSRGWMYEFRSKSDTEKTMERELLQIRNNCANSENHAYFKRRIKIKFIGEELENNFSYILTSSWLHF
jgi:hypothetical protein